MKKYYYIPVLAIALFFLLLNVAVMWQGEQELLGLQQHEQEPEGHFSRLRRHLEVSLKCHPYVNDWYFSRRQLSATLRLTDDDTKKYTTQYELLNGKEWKAYQKRCSKYKYQLFYLVSEDVIGLWASPTQKKAQRNGCKQLVLHSHLCRGNKLCKKARVVKNDNLPPLAIRNEHMLQVGTRKFHSVKKAYKSASTNRGMETTYDVAGNNAADFVTNMLRKMKIENTKPRRKWLVGAFKKSFGGLDDAIRKSKKCPNCRADDTTEGVFEKLIEDRAGDF